MSKLLKLLPLSAILLTSNLLSYDVADKHFGINLVSIGDNSGKGFSYGTNKMWSIDFLTNQFESTEKFKIGNEYLVGVGFDIDYTNIDVSPTNDFVYGGDMKMYIGYDFRNQFKQPFNVKLGLGYDVTVVSSNVYYSGMIYTASTTYDFTDKFGIELNYKRGELDLSLANGTGDSSTKSSFGFNLIFR